MESWKRILYISLPAAGTDMLEPLSMAIITRMVAEFGKEAVGTFGVGGRIESLSLIGVSALSIAISPFIGQNYGARNCDRIRAALQFGIRFSLGWGVLVFALLFSLSDFIASIFSQDKAIVDATVLFLTIIPACSSMS